MNTISVFAEVAHLAHQGVLADDEHLRRIAAGDIIDLLVKAFPKNDGMRRARKIAFSSSEINLFRVDLPNRRIIASVEPGVYGGSEGELRLDGETVIRATSSRGKSFLFSVMKHAALGCASRVGKRSRWRANCKARGAK